MASRPSSEVSALPRIGRIGPVAGGSRGSVAPTVARVPAALLLSLAGECACRDCVRAYAAERRRGLLRPA